jgi:ribosomal protein L7/L12
MLLVDTMSGVALALAGAAAVMFAVARLLDRRNRGSGSPPGTAEVAAEVAAYTAQGRRVEAVKLYRRRTGAGLAEATAAVDEIARRHGGPAGSAADA